MERFRVALYAPDCAIVYDGRTPDETGVGGGITARLSLVEALAEIGHDVIAYVNCVEPVHHAGVRYAPVTTARRIEADVLLAISTGGALTFAPLRRVEVSARLRILWVQGVPRPADLEAVAPDYVYVASNFLRDVCVDRWGVPANKVFVCYNGLKQDVFARIASAAPDRDPFALAFVGPPEKGLDAAIAILSRLRAHDARYQLHVFGGPRLWGQPETALPGNAGVVFHSLLGQQALAAELFRMEYLLAPQGMEEGFGIAVQEARRAGAIVLASAVGSFPELIVPGVDGVLIDLPHTSEASHDLFARHILDLAQDDARRERLRREAMQTPWDWRVAARACAEHWRQALGDSIQDAPEWLALPDGYHSTTTGYYVPRYGVSDQDPPPVRHVLIGGYYGHGNLGDEAILAQMLGELRARHPGVSFSIVSGDPEATRATHHDDVVHERDWPRLIDAAERADLIVLGGGGLLHDHWGTDDATFLTRAHWGLTACAAFAFLASAFERPLLICSVGVGPLDTTEGRRLARLIVERADAVTVRDRASADLLREIGVARADVLVAADPVFLTPPFPGATATAPVRVTVIVRHWDKDDVAAGLPAALAAALDAVITSHQATVHFVAFQSGPGGTLTDDVAAAERVRGLMTLGARTHVLPAPRDAAEAQALFAASSVVVAMRLHAVILSATAGVPVVALAYDPKVRLAMDLAGLGDYALNLSADAATITASVSAALSDRAGISARLGATLPHLRTAAARSFVVAAELLRSSRRQTAPDLTDWQALTMQTLLRQTRRAATHEAGVDFLKGELHAAKEALERSETARAAAARLVIERTEDLVWVAAELGTLRSGLEWRPEHSYRRLRRAVRRYRRVVWRRVSTIAARVGGPLAPRLVRVYETILPAHVRTTVAGAVDRRLMSWPAYTFDRYRRARTATYGDSLEGVRAPGRSELVTVVLPAYNGATMMREAVDSVLGQTYRDLELIIVNDGSTDDTPRIAEMYARVDPRVRVIHQDNLKLPRALSNGFRAARGEFLTWTSCDNRLAPAFLARMVDCLMRHPSWDMAYANLDIIGDDGRPLRNTTFYGPDQRPPGSEHIHLPVTTETLNVVANNSVGAAFLYRSRVSSLIGDYSPHRFVMEDYDYWMRVNALMTLRHVDFEDTLYEYRFHGRSLTSRWDEFNMLGNRDRLMVFDDFRRDFLLGPMVWIIEGDDVAAADAVRARVSRAGHLLAGTEYRLADLPAHGVPLVYVQATRHPLHATVSRADLPARALRVCLSPPDGLPNEMPATWDLCCTVGTGAPPPQLPRPYQGWIQTVDADALFHALDIRAKSDQLARIEALAEAGAAPSLRATVVICTRRAGPGLTEAITSVARQSLPPADWELIVVNNNPADAAITATIDTLRDEVFAGRPGHLRLVVCPVAGLSAARNAAVAEARGDIVAFIDDDAAAEAGWLQTVCAGFAHRAHVGVIGGHIRLRVPEPRPDAVQPGWEKYWSHFVTEHDGFTEVTDWRQFPWGANWSARRAALRAIGGFRTQYGRTGDNYWGGEELVAARLVQRLGYTVAIEPAAVVDHHVTADRFTREHIRRTLPAGYHVGHLALRDGYLPAVSSAIGAAFVPLMTSHVDRTVPEGRYRRLDAWYRKRAQLGVLWRVIGDMVRRVRRPVVS
jgi:polysaccharide pyruvyl transferase CsaB